MTSMIKDVGVTIEALVFTVSLEFMPPFPLVSVRRPVIN